MKTFACVTSFAQKSLYLANLMNNITSIGGVMSIKLFLKN